MEMVKNTSTFGEYLRYLRESKRLTLKQVAKEIGMDISLLSKIERDERQPTQQIIKSVSEFFCCDEKDLKNNFLSDQIAIKILKESADLSILKIAEEKVKYLKTINFGK